MISLKKRALVGSAAISVSIVMAFYFTPVHEGSREHLLVLGFLLSGCALIIPWEAFTGKYGGLSFDDYLKLRDSDNLNAIRKMEEQDRYRR